MAWSVARGAAIGFGMVLLTLIGGGLISFLNTQRLHDQDNSVAHTHEVLTELEGLVSTVKDAETGQRGFIITCDDHYLEPYHNALGELRARQEHLKALISDNQPQADRLQAIDPIIAERISIMERNINVRREKGFEAAQQDIVESGGKCLMDDIRRRVDDMEDVERNLLRDRRAEAQKNYITALVVNTLAVIVSAGVMAAAWYLIRRELQGRIRANQRANAEKERLRITLTSIGDAVIVTDAAGRMTLMNPIAERLTGWGFEAIGKPLGDIFHIINESTRATVESPVAVVLRKGAIVGLANHTVLINRNGAEIPIDDSGAPIRDETGKIIGVVLVFRDITHRRDAEMAQERWNQELLEAGHKKDHFLATLAHELRNPLAPLSNALELWPSMERNPVEMEKLRQMMERQVQQMIRLIDDLLDMSRITRGKIQLRKQPVDVTTLVNGALESVGPFIQKFDHRLSIDLPKQPLYVDGDVARLLQVISNILHNAAKYTGRNGKIWVSAKREQHEAVIRVRDNGPGIPADMLAHIFDMFTQVDQTLDRAHGGLGIGLTLAKTLVGLHGGTIMAHSDGAGCGSEFTVRLPVLDSIHSLPISDAETDSSSRARLLPRHRVLVVDDVQASAKTLALMLKMIGQDVEIRNEGAAALEAAATYQPSVIFLDIGMPQMDGYEVARRLRQQPGLAGVTLVALTGYGQDDDRRRALEAGFNYHLVKPASIEALEQVLAIVPTDPTPANQAST